MHKHSPVNCFVPPHILKNIATNGSSSQKNLAIDTLKITAQMRGQRQALADFSAATFRVAAGGKDRVVYDARNGSNLPGTVVRKEGEDPSADVAVNGQLEKGVKVSGTFGGGMFALLGTDGPSKIALIQFGDSSFYLAAGSALTVM